MQTLPVYIQPYLSYPNPIAFVCQSLEIGMEGTLWGQGMSKEYVSQHSDRDMYIIRYVSSPLGHTFDSVVQICIPMKRHLSSKTALIRRAEQALATNA